MTERCANCGISDQPGDGVLCADCKVAYATLPTWNTEDPYAQRTGLFGAASPGRPAPRQ